jgi:hypothetical protein
VEESGAAMNPHSDITFAIELCAGLVGLQGVFMLLFLGGIRDKLEAIRAELEKLRRTPKIIVESGLEKGVRR